MGVFNLIASDYRKYRKYGGHFFSIVFFTQSFWAIFQHRFAHAVWSKVRLQPFRALCLAPMYLWQKIIEMSTGIAIPASAKIGHSFYIGHFGGVIFNARTVIGNNCNFSQGVTIGVSGQGERRGVPVIGDNVYVGANAVIAGKITVGSNSILGACSLITTDVPENGVMLGVPAVLVSEKGSNGYI
ncbi:MAG: serine acetyltransferase [Flavobacterium sp.]|nr:MAG: serine acetyltransferase [Flavobacterium sp.]